MAVDLFPDRPISALEMKAFSRQEKGEAPLKKYRVYVRHVEVYEVMAVDAQDARDKGAEGHGKWVDSYDSATEVEQDNE